MKYLALFLIIVLATFCALPPQKTTIPPKATSITVTEGTNMAAALSPDKQTLVIDLQGRLWTMSAKGGTAKPITDPFGDARQPSWSPDGDHICFQGYWEGNWHIYRINKEGTDIQQLTSGPYDHREPHWSPDGKHILFSADRGGTYDLWTVTLTTKELQAITKGVANEYAPAWAPSGTRIAYVSDAPDAAGIYMATIKEGNIVKIPSLLSTQKIYTAKGKIAGLSWRPDETSILFQESTFSESQLWVQWLDMPEPIRLSDKTEDVFPFRVNWVSNAEYIYTSSGKISKQSMDFRVETSIPFEATFDINRPSYPKKQRDFNDTSEQSVKGIVTPTLSPDGKIIAFIALNDLWIQQANGTLQQLTNDAAVEISLAWSPDGKEIAYVSDKQGEWGIWSIVMEEGVANRKKVISGNPSNFGLAWSPNGKEIAYSLGIHPRLGQLYAHNLITEETRKISSAIPSSIGAPTWSDNRRAYSPSLLDALSRRHQSLIIF